MNSQEPFANKEASSRQEASDQEESPSLKLLQRALLNLPATVLAIALSIPAVLLLTLFWYVLLFTQVPRNLDELDVDILIGSGLVGYAIGVLFCGSFSLWRFFKQGLMSLFEELSSPPLGPYLTAVLLLFLTMKGVSISEYAALHPMFVGLFAGFAALLPAIVFTRIFEWLFDLSERIFRPPAMTSLPEAPSSQHADP